MTKEIMTEEILKLMKEWTPKTIMEALWNNMEGLQKGTITSRESDVVVKISRKIHIAIGKQVKIAEKENRPIPQYIIDWMQKF